MRGAPQHDVGRGERIESLDNARPEVRNIIENAEMILRASIQRKESRGRLFVRVDYPQPDNENFFCWIGQRKVGEDIVWQKYFPK